MHACMQCLRCHVCRADAAAQPQPAAPAARRGSAAAWPACISSAQAFPGQHSNCHFAAVSLPGMIPGQSDELKIAIVGQEAATAISWSIACLEFGADMIICHARCMSATDAPINSILAPDTRTMRVVKHTMYSPHVHDACYNNQVPAYCPALSIRDC